MSQGKASQDVSAAKYARQTERKLFVDLYHELSPKMMAVAKLGTITKTFTLNHSKIKGRPKPTSNHEPIPVFRLTVNVVPITAA